MRIPYAPEGTFWYRVGAYEDVTAFFVSALLVGSSPVYTEQETLSIESNPVFWKSKFL